jgi:hypothetical protein
MIVAVTAGGSGGSFCFDPRRQKKKEEKRAQTGGLRRMSGANFAKERHWSIPQYLKESDENGAYEVGMKSKRPRKAQRGDQTKKKADCANKSEMKCEPSLASVMISLTGIPRVKESFWLHHLSLGQVQSGLT